jgi:DNA polymerase III epsilon subunit family exonuclease
MIRRMSQTFVAFDLETTGLDPKTDAIIEIGMVRFDETGILEEFSTLVNPGMTVSEEIENITGITNADVATAPVFGDVREKVSRFFGNSAIVAHNADFDMAFLAQRGFDFSLNGVVDTFRLAQMAFMGERSMNLSGLADAAGHSHEGAHRALSDARATVSVFQECFRRIAASEGVLRTAYRFLRSAVPNLSTFEVAGAAAFSGNAEPSASAFELFACLAKEIPEYEDLPRMEKPKAFPNAVEILSSDPALEKRGEQ